MFEVGDHLFATEVTAVQEVLEPTEATPIPGAVSGVLGLVNLRGTLVVAAELAALFGLPGGGGPDAALVVFEREGRRVALRVDRVIGIVSVGGELDVDGQLLDALGCRDVTVGVGQVDSRPYYRIDLGALFERVLERDRRGQRTTIGG